MKWRYLLLLLFLSLSVTLPVSSLTPSEIDVLPSLKKEALIEIILSYDSQEKKNEARLNEREEETSLREKALQQRESNLDKRETSLSARESACLTREANLKIREDVLDRLYKTQEAANRESFWKGVGVGVVSTGALTITYKIFL